jgi:hypothetical protein
MVGILVMSTSVSASIFPSTKKIHYSYFLPSLFTLFLD